MAKSVAGEMIYHFENCSLDIERHELRRDGILRQIEPQVFKLLRFLIQNRERVVTREEIFKVVWQGRIVSDSVQSTRINAIRHAIGDDGKQQRLIQTLRRVGYRFIGTVHEHEFSTKPTANPVIVRYRKPILIVLFAINLSADEELVFISKEIKEDVVTALVRSKSFDVIAHSGNYYENNLTKIARGFAANYMLVLGARCTNDRLRLSARLVDASTGIHIWARNYTRAASAESDDLDGIVSNVVASVESIIYMPNEDWRRQKSLDTLDARDCVRAALSIARQRSRQNYAVAETLLGRALELDPTSVRAHSIAAWFAGSQVIYGWKSRESALAPGLDAAYNAIQLDPHDPWAHFALGWVLTQNRSTEEGAEEYRRALAINPYFSLAYPCLGLALAYLGQTDEALKVLENGDRMNAPEIFVGLTNSARAGIYFCAEKHHDAIKAARSSVQQGPGLVASHRQLVVNCALAGEMGEARAAFKTLVQLVPGISLNSVANALPHVHTDHVSRTLEVFRLMGVR